MKNLIDTILSWDYFTRAALLGLSNAAFYLSQIHLEADPLLIALFVISFAVFLFATRDISVKYGRWHFWGVLAVSMCVLHAGIFLPLVVCGAALALGYIFQTMADDFRAERRLRH